MSFKNLFLLVLLVGLLTACSNTNDKQNRYTLPDLSGKTIDNYKEAIDSPKITFVEKKEYNDVLAVDEFIRYDENLSAGDQVDFGDMVYIYFSKGPAAPADTESPQIHGISDGEIKHSAEFDPLEGVTVTDDIDTDLIDRLVVTGQVNTSKFNDYTLTYTVMDRSGKMTQETRIITIIPGDIDTRYTDQLTLDQDFYNKTFLNDGIGIVTLAQGGCVDGDTAEFIDSDGSPLTGDNRVRFIGIDTPETSPYVGVQPWGHAAKDFTCEKLKNAEQIVLESEGTLKGNYGRYMAWIWVDGRLLNLEILEEALAEGKAAGTKYSEIFNLAEIKTKGTKERIFGNYDSNGAYDPDYDYENNVHIGD
ncbi:immunoglobulin-like domain-containing protein [Haloplasma contractile]|uniref:Thermonuclease protein n=1 Tax=Haloplasma contractile SSD-17B TaxID=1033810 RepID=U2DZG6_9MOLU|nr:thermonuclease family protein [Haloplasma contractile]ERJ13592.1 Thermonuclease protein [Haloplasma contractile SSD-17B]